MDYFFHLLMNAEIFIILAISLNLINGICGQFSLGHAGFWAIGAYSAAAFGVYGAFDIPPFLNLILSCLIGIASSALAGLFIGIPTLRLRGDYLAIATLGMGEIIRIVIVNTDSVGGPRGFTNIPVWAGPISVGIFMLFCFAFLRNLMMSTHGRAIISVRENEIAAESMGVNIFKMKILAFVMGAGMAGLGGALFAHTQQFLHPNGFTFMWSVIILLMVILGGLGSFSGAAFGAIILSLLPEILRLLSETISQWRMVIYSLLLILLMLLRPQGIMGKREVTFGPLKYLFPQN